MPGLAPHLYAGRWMLCLARLHAGKGQDLVLDIWRALSKEARAELSLFFVGQETQAGYREYLDQKILDLPDRERLFIAGPSEHPQDWIQASDLFISGSLLEGMPLAPLEAAGSGLPTILSDIEGHRELVALCLQCGRRGRVGAPSERNELPACAQEADRIQDELG